jgi:hypothetical protein
MTSISGPALRNTRAAGATVGGALPVTRLRIAAARRGSACIGIAHRAARTTGIAAEGRIRPLARGPAIGNAGAARAAVVGADPAAGGRIAAAGRGPAGVAIADRAARAAGAATERRIRAPALGPGAFGHAGASRAAIVGADPASRRSIAVARRRPASVAIAGRPGGATASAAEGGVRALAARRGRFRNAGVLRAVCGTRPVPCRFVAGAVGRVASVGIADHPARTAIFTAQGRRIGALAARFAVLLAVAPGTQ